LGWRWCHFLICWLNSHSCEISPVFPSDSPNKWYQSRWFAAWVSSYGEGSWVMYSSLRLLPINVVEKELTLEGEIVRCSSVSRSPTLGRNEKVKQHIRKKTRKTNALRFWVEGGVISSLYVGSSFILVRSPRFSPRILATNWISTKIRTVYTTSTRIYICILGLYTPQAHVFIYVSFLWWNGFVCNLLSVNDNMHMNLKIKKDNLCFHF